MVRSNLKIQVCQWLGEAKALLSKNSSEPNSTVWALLCHVTSKPQAWLIAHPEFLISAHDVDFLNNSIKRIMRGYPLAYITNTKSFFGLDFFINSSVLVPRPETELMVTMANEWLNTNADYRSMAEIGVGSGCVSIALAKQIPTLKIMASDLSWPALMIAKININTFHLHNQISLIQSHLLTFTQYKFDLICANLPYIPSRQLDKLEVNRFEPRHALDGGEDGLLLIRECLQRSPNWLQKNGMALLEIEYHQEKLVVDLAHTYFPQKRIRVLKDLAQLPRLLVIDNYQK